MPDVGLKTVLANEHNCEAPPGAREHLHIQCMTLAIRQRSPIFERNNQHDGVTRGNDAAMV